MSERDADGNVPRPEGFKQVCIWPGTVCGAEKVAEFVQFMVDEFDVRIAYLEEVASAPDRTPGGYPVSGTGGLNLLVFAVHDEDIGKFAIPRLGAGIRWIEDFTDKGNNTWHMAPERFSKYGGWKQPTPDECD